MAHHKTSSQPPRKQVRSRESSVDTSIQEEHSRKTKRCVSSSVAWWWRGGGCKCSNNNGQVFVQGYLIFLFLPFHAHYVFCHNQFLQGSVTEDVSCHPGLTGVFHKKVAACASYNVTSWNDQCNKRLSRQYILLGRRIYSPSFSIDDPSISILLSWHPQYCNRTITFAQWEGLWRGAVA